jgi:plastocyanin
MVRLLQHSTLALLAAAKMAQSKPAAIADPTITKAPSLTVVKRAPETHTVSVGYGGEFKFVPLITYAHPGDKIQFNFYPQNHSVVRSEFGYPCIPSETLGEKADFFFSEFQPVKETLDHVSADWAME